MEIGRVAMPAANMIDRISTTAFGSGVPKSGTAGAGKDFASLIQASLGQVDAMQGRAQAAIHQYQLGQNGVVPGDAVASMQKADLAFRTTVQVRDKVVAAYNDVMNMQL